MRGIALCVDFEVHKNSNKVSPGQDAKFICRLYMDGAPIDPIVYTVPRDKICVGSFGIWLYISHKRIREVDQCDCIRPLIRTNSADIEIKGCGARILYESDVVGFVQHLSQNIFGSPDDLRRGSEDYIKCHLGNSQSRDDKVESSHSNALIEPSPRLRSALWSLLSRLYEVSCYSLLNSTFSNSFFSLIDHLNSLYLNIYRETTHDTTTMIITFHKLQFREIGSVIKIRSPT